jgi:hypothetical protein
MRELLGFIVLSSPLFLVVIWVPVCLFLAISVGRNGIKKSLPLKIAGGVTVFLVTLFLPVSDEITGRIYFNHLCETEAGMRVYQPMELPTEYWNENGELKLLKSNGDFDFRKIEWLHAGWEDVKNKSSSSMDESHWIVREVKNNQPIGAIVTYCYWGGWVRRNFSPHNTAQSCSQVEGKKFHRDFYLSIFKPTQTEGRHSTETINR